MRRRYGFLLFALVQSAYPADVVMMIGDNPPFNAFRAGKPEGMAVEIVDEMLNRANLSADKPDYPWARIFNSAQNNANHCAYSVSRTPERESLFQWVGPIAFNHWAFFSLKDRKIKLSRIEDAVDYRVGGQRKDGKANWLEKRGFKIDYATTESQTLKKLVSGRIDIYPAGLHSIQEMAARNGIKQDLLEPVLVFHRVDYYVACSQITEQRIVQGLTKALESMKADNTLGNISQKYEGILSSPALPGK